VSQGVKVVSRYQILLTDVGDVFCLCVLCIKVVEGLVSARTNLFRYRLVPFFRVAERRVNVKNYAVKVKKPMLDDLPYIEFGVVDHCLILKKSATSVALFVWFA
jgi:hypothetical protein